jgi:ribonuclease P protein component
LQSKAFLPTSYGYSLKKPERLCSKKAFEFLFTQGKTVFIHPLKIVYSFEKSSEPSVKVAFTVSKRNFKRAVKRNRIKRLLREAYRKNKITLAAENLQIVILYISKEIEDYSSIENKLIKGLDQIVNRIKKNS